jgi:hypothetical protein
MSSSSIQNDLVSLYGSNHSNSSHRSAYTTSRTALAMPSTASVPGSFLSEIESAILRSSETPIPIDETEELTVLGQRGIWANRSEVISKKDYNFN